MSIDEIRRVCYVGAGTMGCYNAMVAALSGYTVMLYDIDAKTLAGATQTLRSSADLLVGGGYCKTADIAPAMARITQFSDLAQATADADLVSESVFERLDIKRAVHQQLDQLCPPKTVITTNSSHLLVSEIEDVLARGDRFAAMHSHLGSPLVDIVPGPRTDPAVPALLARYVVSLGGTPLLLNKEYPGYVLNAMLGSVLGAGLQLWAVDGYAFEDIDRVWMKTQRASVGPFGLMDYFGLPLIVDGQQLEGDATKARYRDQILPKLEAYVARGDLGIKTGKGFYDYSLPSYQQPNFVHMPADGEALAARLSCALIGTAILINAEDVLDIAGIDTAWKIGTHLPVGPFELLQQTGYARFGEMLSAITATGYMDTEKTDRIQHWLGSTNPATPIPAQ